MYGTRDAPVEWQKEMANTMLCIGFDGVQTAPCLYFHPELDVYAIIHVDDLIRGGSGAGPGEVAGGCPVH